MRRLLFSGAVVLCIAAIGESADSADGAEAVQTTNTMPSAADNQCMKALCPQGGLWLRALRAASSTKIPDASVFVVNANDLSGSGWVANTSISDSDFADLHAFEAKLCSSTLRGVSLLVAAKTMVESADLHPGSNIETNYDTPILQFEGLRVTYSSTLPATERLLNVEVWDSASTSYTAVDRAKLYTVVYIEEDSWVSAFDNSLWEGTREGESAQCYDDPTAFKAGEMVKQFVAAHSPYTIPDVSGRLVHQAGGNSMTVFQKASDCAALESPHIFKADLMSCVPCSGSDCDKGDKQMETTNDMPSSDLCETVACGQGALFADAMRHLAGSDVGWTSPEYLTGDGWSAGAVSPQDVAALYEYPEAISKQTLRGATLLRLVDYAVQAAALQSNAADASSGEGVLFVFSGLRIEYSSEASPSNRLVGVTILNRSTGSYEPLDRQTLYSVAGGEYDTDNFEDWFSNPILNGETSETSAEYGVGEIITKFLEEASPYTIPEPATLIVAVPSITTITVIHDAAYCQTLTPKHGFSPSIASCVVCVDTDCTNAASTGGGETPPPELTGMNTTNSLPSKADDKCGLGPCFRGMLITNALLHAAGPDYHIAFIEAAGMDGNGWAAGTPVSESQLRDLYVYDENLCTMKVRGVTLLKMAEYFVSDLILGSIGDANDNALMQYSGLRLTYSTTLPAMHRLLKAEVWDSAADSFVPVNRSGLYRAVAFSFDYNRVPGASHSSLRDEDGSCYEAGPREDIFSNFLKETSPYTIPDPSGLLVSQAGGTAVAIESTADECAAMVPPLVLDESYKVCMSCPDGKVVQDGYCVIAPETPAPMLTVSPVSTNSPASATTAAPEAATEAPVDPVTNAPVESASISPAESTTYAPVKPVTEAPTTDAPTTATPVITEVPHIATTNAPETNPTEAPLTETPLAEPTSAPLASVPGGFSAGQGHSAKGESSGAPVGAIIGAVVGVLVLIVGIAAAVFLVLRSRAKTPAVAADDVEETHKHSAVEVGE